MNIRITATAAMSPATSMKVLAVLLACTLFVPKVTFSADAGNASDSLSLPPLFSDHMVLQRGQPTNIWGLAEPGKVVEVLFRKTRVETKADSKGHWAMVLPAMDVGGPYQMTIKSGLATRTINDVFWGEVWLAAGQSNMAFRFGFSDEDDKAKALAILKNADIRMYKVAAIVSGGKLLKENDVPWTPASREEVADWSAVALYFAQALQVEEGVAIGIINSSQGSSTIEAWMSPAALAKAKSSGYISTKTYDDIRRHYRNPSVLHQSMLSKIVPYTLKGVLWYQGESNGGEAESYRILLPALVESWRGLWDQKLPFLFAQLPAYEPPDDKTGQSWARFRQAQAEVDKTVPGTGMVVLIDAGDKHNIHPKKKKIVGDRFANLAMAQVYGKNVAYTGPVMEKIEYDGDRAIVSLHLAGKDLVVKGEVIKGFSVKSGEGIWYSASAEATGNKVVVWHPEVGKVTGVRYGWANAPEVNLYNNHGYPAAPFIHEH